MPPSTRSSRSARQSEVLSEVSRLLVILQQLELEDANDSAPPVPPAPPRPPPAEIQPGAWVRITRRDKYHGRLGIVVSRHGTQFWNIRLQRLEGEVMAIIIHKKDHHLVLIPAAPAP